MAHRERREVHASLEDELCAFALSAVFDEGRKVLDVATPGANRLHSESGPKHAAVLTHKTLL